MPERMPALPRVYMKTVVHEQNPRSARTHTSGHSDSGLNIDAAALAEDLKTRISGEVRFDNGSRALYATDASNYHMPPIGVVLPKTVEDVIETVAACRKYAAPILSRGGGTSIAGQCCNTAVVIDTSKYFNQILEINADKKFARVRPGLVLDTLRAHAIRQAGLTFGPDPATHTHCTLGGMIGNNACGIHSVMSSLYGSGPRTSDNVEELDIITYDGCRMRVGKTSDTELNRMIAAGGRRGEIYQRLKQLRDRYADLIRARYPKIPRRVSGYNLDELLPENGFNVARALVGSESTLVTILEAQVTLLKNPPARTMVVLGYPDVYSAGDHVSEILEFKPIGLEGIDDQLIRFIEKTGVHKQNVALLPPGGGWLLVEFGAETQEESNESAQRMIDAIRRRTNAPSAKLLDDPDEQTRIWEVRESGLGVTAFVPGLQDTWEGWEDSAVPPDRVGDYLRDLRKLFHKFGYDSALYGHFGQGCIHCRIPFVLTTAEGIRDYVRFTDEAADLVLRYGGSFSGEHGDGQSRGELLPKLFGTELYSAFLEFKSIWDPEWKMNPGKIVDANRRDSDLRLGTEYQPAEPETHFKFVEDRYSFSRAALRCVGVGKCRREEGGTMCPSYMVLREEKHTTRGRAHLLFEMLRGELIDDGWRSEEVKESLDLCLACKGCKGDCPVNVDVATYKAEFLSHYYKHRMRPPHAYAFGLVHIWATLASKMPRLANFFSQNSILSAIGKRLAGVAPERALPKFAVETFKEQFRRRCPTNLNKPRVLLFADTFNNHFHPQVAMAAAEVLEDAGFQITVPRHDVCCGRPLYDYGMLDTAKRWLQHLIANWRTEIRAGTPVVVLEPSCCAVFRDELTNLFPHDEDAKRLKTQTFTLSEFLTRYAPAYPYNQLLGRKALVHLHCHHRAIMKTEAETELLRKLGLEIEIPEPGCCGMAGAFGFENGKPYDVSIQCAERKLLPAVRCAEEETLLIADGFSCHEQMALGTDRRVLHLSELLLLAKREGTHRPGAPTPPHVPEPLLNWTNGNGSTGPQAFRRVAQVGLGAGAVLAGAAAAIVLARRMGRR